MKGCNGMCDRTRQASKAPPPHAHARGRPLRADGSGPYRRPAVRRHDERRPRQRRARAPAAPRPLGIVSRRMLWMVMCPSRGRPAPTALATRNTRLTIHTFPLPLSPPSLRYPPLTPLTSAFPLLSFRRGRSAFLLRTPPRRGGPRGTPRLLAVRRPAPVPGLRPHPHPPRSPSSPPLHPPDQKASHPKKGRRRQ